MRMGLRHLGPTIFLLWCMATGAFAESSVPQAHLDALRRGINLAGRYQQAAFTPVSDEDLDSISRTGFSFIRLPIEPTILVRNNLPTSESGQILDNIADVVRRATEEYGLAVVVDFHPLKAYWDANPEGSRQDIQTHALVWKMLTVRLAGFSPNRVFYEIVNEPRKLDVQQYMQTLAANVRKQAPSHTLLVGPGDWNSLRNLGKLKPLKDRNIVYTFHIYEPSIFTHQGASWTEAPEGLRNLKGVTYPVDRERDTALYTRLVADFTVKGDLASAGKVAAYALTGFNRESLKELMRPAKAWSDKFGVPMVMDEFGVIRGGASDNDRNQWIGDVRELAEEMGFGWAMWEYDSIFGLKRTLGDGNKVIDPDTVRALGLEVRK
jgi:endoglucanase